MEKTAVFTIIREERTNGWFYDVKSKAHNTYNKCGLNEHQLFEAMEELSDVFNNVLGMGILFEVG